MATKLDEIFVSFAEALEDLSKTISNDSSSYEFEASYNDLIRNFGQSVFQSVVGNIPKSKNGRTTILTSMGSMVLTRQKDNAWKEVKLCRTFQSNDRVENISKERNYIDHSIYVARTVVSEFKL